MRKILISSILYFLLGCNLSPQNSGENNSSSSSSQPNWDRVKWICDIGYSNVRCRISPVLDNDEKLIFGSYGVIDSGDYDTNFIIFCVDTNGNKKWTKILLTNDEYYSLRTFSYYEIRLYRGDFGAIIDGFPFFLLGNWVVKINPNNGNFFSYPYYDFNYKFVRAIEGKYINDYIFFTSNPKRTEGKRYDGGTLYRFNKNNSNNIMSNECLSNGYSALSSLADGRILEFYWWGVNVFDDNFNLVTNYKYNYDTNLITQAELESVRYAIKIGNNYIVNNKLGSIDRFYIDNNLNFYYKIQFFNTKHFNFFILVDAQTNYFVVQKHDRENGHYIVKISKTTLEWNEGIGRLYTNENWTDYPYFTNHTITNDFDQSYVWYHQFREEEREIYSCPVLGSDNRVYVATRNGNVYCFNGDNGNVEWKLSLNEEVTAELVMDRTGTLYVATDYGKIYAIRTDSPRYGGIYPMYRRNPQRNDN